MVFFEFASYHPTCVLNSRELLVIVIGDSIQTGIERWSRHFVADASRIKLHRWWSPGMHRLEPRTESAINQLDNLPKQCVFAVQIGSSDLLCGQSAAEFQTDLDRLLIGVQSSEN